MFQLLEYIEDSSPECLLQNGVPLNLPCTEPHELSVDTQKLTINAINHTKSDEKEYIDNNRNLAR